VSQKPQMVPVSFVDIQSAARRIAPYVHRTPMLHSALINQLAGCEIFFKCENLQKAGAFKARGAYNAVLLLSDEQRRRGVATHSSGNHAAALALAASHFQMPAYIVMPENSPASKVAAVRSYGGEITFCEATQLAREAALAERVARTGAEFIPPYDHPDVIAGQGTVVLEMAEQLTLPPDYLLTPVGGGGLLAGSAIASKTVWPHTAVIGAEPLAADDAQRSFRSGQRHSQLPPVTVADGLRTALGHINFGIIRRDVDDILTVSDDAIISAMRLVWSRMKLIVEPSAAVGLAVVLSHPERFADKRVAIVFSGGNVDLDKLPW
jgi:threonine dehydratase